MINFVSTLNDPQLNFVRGICDLYDKQKQKAIDAANAAQDIIDINAEAPDFQENDPVLLFNSLRNIRVDDDPTASKIIFPDAVLGLITQCACNRTYSLLSGLGLFNDQLTTFQKGAIRETLRSTLRKEINAEEADTTGQPERRFLEHMFQVVGNAQPDELTEIFRLSALLDTQDSFKNKFVKRWKLTAFKAQHNALRIMQNPFFQLILTIAVYSLAFHVGRLAFDIFKDTQTFKVIGDALLALKNQPGANAVISAYNFLDNKREIILIPFFIAVLAPSTLIGRTAHKVILLLQTFYRAQTLFIMYPVEYIIRKQDEANRRMYGNLEARIGQHIVQETIFARTTWMQIATRSL